MGESFQEEQLIELAVNWIATSFPNTVANSIDISAGTDLLQEGILDSLGLVDLLAFLEKTTGHEIDLLELDEDSLGTLHGLCCAAIASDPMN